VIGEEDLQRLAVLNGLELGAFGLPAILANLQRIEQVAQLMNAVELRPEDELAPEWRP
jgi:hypothetical protein